MLIRSNRVRFAACLLAGVAALLLGCDGHDHEHDHNHANGHDHGDGDGDHADDHGGDGGGDVHRPQKGGVLAPIGDHFANAELVLDPGTGTLTVYFSGPHAEQPTRVEQAVIDTTITVGEETIALPLSAVANPLTGETVGDTSQFEGTTDRLKGVTDFEITIAKIDIRGKTFQNLELHFHADEAGKANAHE